MIKLFADGADWTGITESAKNPKISGFTTNPSLMKQAGVTDYVLFSKQLIEFLKKERPETCLSLEVFADDQEEMFKQANTINSWSEGYNVYVKIPIMNTQKVYNYDLIKKLNDTDIKVNVTAVFTHIQIQNTINSLNMKKPNILSVFAGRIADTGIDPTEIISNGIKYRNYISNGESKIEFLWASTREVYNYVQATNCGCDIVTITPDLIKKMDNLNKPLEQFSQETVAMFYNDAVNSGYTID